MKHKYFKLIIAFLMLIFGIYLIYDRNTGWGILVIILSLIPIALYFRNEYILMAFWKLRGQNMDAAENWLNKITDMEKQLVRKQYGYYSYLKGMLEGKNNNITKMESYTKKALDYGLSFKHDRAMANFNLAIAAASKGKKQEAEKYFAEAKKLDTAGLLTNDMKLFKDQMKKANVGRNMHNPHMRHRGKFG